MKAIYALIVFLHISLFQGSKTGFPPGLRYTDNTLVTATELRSGKASVFIFLAPECPVCQSYTLTLNSLYSRFRSSGIEFYGIFTGTSNTKAEINAFQNKYKLAFKVMEDPDSRLRSFFQARVTPEVFVTDKNQHVLYSGRIDNWVYALGSHRKVITENDLKDALTAIQKNTLILKKRTEPVGCLIE